VVAARSCGLAAIAVPGTGAWQPAWAQLLTGRFVIVVMDCDPAGRHAATAIAESLQIAGVSVEVVDLWPDRADGYDLTDRILEHRRARHRASSTQTPASLLRPVPTVNAKRKPAPARSTQEVTQ
jgi:DNA primase